MVFPDFKNRLPSFWTIQIAGWAVYLGAIYITFLTVAQPGYLLSLFYIKAVRTIIGFVLTSFLMRPVYLRLSNGRSIQTLVFLVLTCAVVFGSAWAALEGCYNFLTAANFNFPNFVSRFPRYALDYAMTLTAWSALYLGVKNWLAWQRERENALAAAALANQAQLEMLRYQLNPHFLFNALNSIRASVDEDAARARAMITSLSEFLRYSLLSGREKEVSLAEEIEAVKNYLAIEKIRFERRLEVSFKIEPAAEDFPVPCFLLNPLVENAVKHGFANGKPLKILVSARIENNRLDLQIANTGAISGDSKTNNVGLGLKNVCERLEKLFPDRSSFVLSESGGWVRAEIMIAR